MAKQKLGKKKHARCEAVTGRKYHGCYVRGGWEHFDAECWWLKEECPNGANADDVNWKTGTWRPAIRNGQFVGLESTDRCDEVAPNGLASSPASTA